MASFDSSCTATKIQLLDDVVGDIFDGGLRPLDHYLARYPQHVELVRGEYEAVLRDRSERAAGPDERPTRIGPYAVIDELGRGGQGRVFLCWDAANGRRVAVKSLHARLGGASRAARKRLQREAEAITRLDHPSLCSMLQADLESDEPWIAMRFVEGRSLSSWLKRAGVVVPDRGASGPPVVPRSETEARELARFFADIALALHAAHEAGVLHRDVKPENVRVTPEGRPVLIDFGLAWEEGNVDSLLTMPGQVLGTLPYLAPEQVADPKPSIDRRVDVYQLGVTLYEVLTGDKPFRGDTPDLLLARIAAGGPVPPEKRNRNVPFDLATVCLRAFAVDRRHRYETSADLARDLANAAAGRRVEARRPSTALRVLARARRSPMHVAGLAISAAVVASVLALWRAEVADNRAWSLAYRFAAGRTTPEDLEVLTRALPGRSDEERSRIASQLRAGDLDQELRELLAHAQRGGSETIELFYPRAAIADARPMLRWGREESRTNAGNVEVHLECDEQPAASFTFTVREEADAAATSVPLPAERTLECGTWRWSVLDQDADGARSRWCAFRVVPAVEVDRLLAGAGTRSDRQFDRWLRAALLLQAQLGSEALQELGEIDWSSPAASLATEVELACNALALMGEYGRLEETASRWRSTVAATGTQEPTAERSSSHAR